MRTYEERFASFKKWMYGDNAKCSKREMALAGFFSIAADTAQCYWCQKTLDGWEENDDPWEEHKSHAPYCPFVQKFQTPPHNVTLVELLGLTRDQAKLKLKREHEAYVKEINAAFETITEKRNTEQRGKKRRGKY